MTREEVKVFAVERLNEAGFDASLAGVDFTNIVEAISDASQEPKRGLMFIGSAGCGKTLAMKALNQTAHFIDLTNTKSLIDCMPYKREVLIHGLTVEKEDMWTIEDNRSVILDDLGNEPIRNNYGVKEQTVANFILQWYSASYKNPAMKARLFVTTNLTVEQLIELYGVRIVDRLFEMVHIVNFKSKSHRKAGKTYG